MPFCCFEAFGEIHRELFFLDIKVTTSKTSTEILRKLVFLPCLKRANSEENLDMFTQVFLIKTLKGYKYLQNCFSPQGGHILLNYAFLLFWSFLGNS